MTDEDKSTIRFSVEDRKNIRKIIDSGAAQNTAEAVRIGLAIAGGFFSVKPGDSAELVLRDADGAASSMRWTRRPKKSEGRR